MPTTIARTARELYDCDATCRAFVAEWDKHRRCNIVFVEYLTDNELFAAAACAMWAATEPERLIWGTPRAKGSKSFPHPTNGGMWGSFWCVLSQQSLLAPLHANEVPEALVKPTDERPPRTIGTGTTDRDKAYLEILWLLDAWRDPTA